MKTISVSSNRTPPPKTLPLNNLKVEVGIPLAERINYGAAVGASITVSQVLQKAKIASNVTAFLRFLTPPFTLICKIAE